MRGLLCSPLFVRFICVRLWGREVLPATLPAPFSTTLSPALLVYLCANVGMQGLLVFGLPAPFVPHSASLCPAMATRVLSTPVPVSAPPTVLDECLFFISLVSDFLALGFSVSSSCVRRHSVSTYAAILVLSDNLNFLNFIVVRTQHEIDLLNIRLLSVQYGIAICRHNVTQQTPKTYSSCFTETLFLPISNSPSHPPPTPAPGNHQSMLLGVCFRNLV